MMEQKHFGQLQENDTYIRPEDGGFDSPPAEHEGLHAWRRRALGMPRGDKTG